jgi:hypothetical protein
MIRFLLPRRGMAPGMIPLVVTGDSDRAASPEPAAREPEPAPHASVASRGGGRTRDASADARVLPARVVLLVACAACLAAIGLVGFEIAPGVAAVALMTVLAIAPGAAFLPLLGARGDGLGLGVIIGASLAVSVLVAQGMLWFGLWEPRLAALAVSAACLPVLMRHLHRAVASADRPPEGAPAARAPSSAWGMRHLALLEAAVGLWILGIIGTRVDAIAGLGLLDAFPLTFFGTVVVLILGFVNAATREVVSPRLMATYVILLALVLHASAALLYDVPRYSWTYKHIGVTDRIGACGCLDRDLDIYNNWPGFFSLGGWLSRASGVAPIDLAAWAQPFFALAAIAALVFVARGISTNPAVVWTAVLLFLLSDWIGQNYYAPQALAFVLSLVVLGLCLRCAPPARPDGPRVPRPLAGLLRRPVAWFARARAVDAASRGAPPLPPGSALAVGAVCFVAVVVSHQLSPIMLAAQVVAVAFVLGRIRVWILAAGLAIEVTWIALAYPFLSDKFDLFAFDLGSTPETGLPSGPTSKAMAFIGLSQQGLMLAIVALAAAGVFAAHRRRRLQIVLPVLAGVPVLVLAVQPYGGEGVLRTYLFALPWLCILGAIALQPSRARPFEPIANFVRLAFASAILALLFLPAYYGREEQNRVTRDDVEVATWLERHAPPGSSLVKVIESYPGALTKDYTVFGSASEGGVSLVDYPEFRDHDIGPDSLAAVRRILGEQPGSPRYLALTPLMQRTSDAFDVFPKGDLNRLRAEIDLAPDFEVVFRSGDGVAWRWMPRGRPAVAYERQDAG